MGPYQFKGSSGSEVGVGTKIRALVSWCMSRTLPKVRLRCFSSPWFSTLGSNAVATVTSMDMVVKTALFAYKGILRDAGSPETHGDLYGAHAKLEGWRCCWLIECRGLYRSTAAFRLPVAREG